MNVYIPRTYETETEAQAFVDALEPDPVVKWTVICGDILPVSAGTYWLKGKWIAWPESEEPDHAD
jgi:hypothetical protein